MTVQPKPSVSMEVGRTRVEVSDAHGPNWFPLNIEAELLRVTLYFRRSELRALRDRLDEIDRDQPEPEKP